MVFPGLLAVSPFRQLPLHEASTAEQGLLTFLQTKRKKIPAVWDSRQQTFGEKARKNWPGDCRDSSVDRGAHHSSLAA